MKKFMFLVFLALTFFSVYFPITALEKEVLFETGVEALIREEKLDSFRASNFSFITFQRYPAEERSWIPAENDTVYYRDLLVGGQTAITATRDGEMWHAIAELPDGTRVYWPDLVFYEEYEGEEDVFIFTHPTNGWKISGTKNIYSNWYSTVQGGPVGQWTMHFYHDRQLAFTREFTLLPQIPPGKVPLFNQGDYGDNTNEDHVIYIDDDENIRTIKNIGCALVSCVMLLNYHGVDVDPEELNAWLKENNGYYNKRLIIWKSVAEFAQEKGTNICFRGTKGDLFKDISTYGPQIISVNNRGHWTAATGRDQDLTTYLINDPSGGVETTLEERYNNKHEEIRVYTGPEYEFVDDLSAIIIYFHSPGELVINDPHGRRTGFDPIAKEKYEEIPSSNYTAYQFVDDESGEIIDEPITELMILQPLEGEYHLEVIGTERGTYTLTTYFYDKESNRTEETHEDIPIYPGAIHSYDWEFKKETGPEPTPTPTPTPPPGEPKVRVEARSETSNPAIRSLVRMNIWNEGPTSLSQLSTRYFLDLTEVYAAGYSAEDVTIDIYYTSAGKVEASPLIVYDGENHIYYYELDWGSHPVAPGGRIETNFSVHLAGWQPVWDGSNDWSYWKLLEAYTDTEHIPVYMAGELIQGLEPESSVIPPTPPPGEPKVRVEARSETSNPAIRSLVRMNIWNEGPTPLSQLSIRYFLDLTEVYAADYSAEDVTIDIYYTSAGKVEASPLTVYDGENHIYYYELDWGSHPVAPGGRIETNFSVHLAGWQPVWDGSNDWSYWGLLETYIDTEHIPVYMGVKLIQGLEPPSTSDQDIVGEVKQDMNDWNFGRFVHDTGLNSERNLVFFKAPAAIISSGRKCVLAGPVLSPEALGWGGTYQKLWA